MNESIAQKARRPIIDGEPINGGVAENIVFAGGVSPNMKVKFLQMMYMFPHSFNYDEIVARFDVSRRTAMRWVAQLKDLGLIDYAYKRSEGTIYARYRFKEDWR